MTIIAGMGFLNPWLLLGLLGLPLIWWLIRITPPAPLRVRFPPLALLFGLESKQETVAHTPWWLLILRMVIAALIMLALSHPLLNPNTEIPGSGPVMLVIDDGWAGAHHWSKRLSALTELLDRADRADRPVILFPTAPAANNERPRPGRLMPADAARAQLAALEPKPWASDRPAALAALADAALPANLEIFWLTDGLDDGGAEDLAKRLGDFGPVNLIVPEATDSPLALLPPVPETEGLRIGLLRAEKSSEAEYWLRAYGDQGRLLERLPVTFAVGKSEAHALLTLPTEIRNRVTRLEIEDHQSAGATVLIDERFRHRPVGLVSGAAAERNQPLLSDLYYLERALAPFSEVRTGDIGALLQRQLSVLVLSDIATVVGDEKQQVEAFLAKGGILVRFAGLRMAEGADDLTPVKLREGGRSLGGLMSWEQPAELSPFPPNSPFAGLTIPRDIRIQRQILAEPTLDLGDKTWARLSDGTPLVTAARRGEGWLVLFHVTANTQWSNLPLSGLFVDMLRRLVELSQGVGSDLLTADTLAPYLLLDGFGRLNAASGAAQPISGADIRRTTVDPLHPPGFYGGQDYRLALNLTAGFSALAPFPDLPAGFRRYTLETGQEKDLLPLLLAAALGLCLFDQLIGLFLRGYLRVTGFSFGRKTALMALIVGLVGLAFQPEADAQTVAKDKDAAAFAGSLEFRLAYVVTGNAEVDRMSAAGLAGLTRALTQRTSVEPAVAQAVSVEKDDILFFPLLYWPILPEQPLLSPAALVKLDRFFKTGGSILFDTRDQDIGGFGPGDTSPAARRLRQLLAKLDIPPLTPVPEDHILAKAFYLLREFPGRFPGGQVWVERYAGGSNDGVTPIIIGGNDWAAAWAIDDQGRPLAAVAPGGARQRELAIRFGINLVMYALTGNYKADQVHIPALLERLGQ